MFYVTARYQYLQKQLCQLQGTIRALHTEPTATILEPFYKNENKKLEVWKAYTTNIENIKTAEIAIEAEKKSFRSKNASLNVRIAGLMNEMHDHKMTIDTTYRYTTAYNRTRCTNNEWMHSIEKGKALDHLRKRQDQFGVEKVVHENILGCNEQSYEDMTAKIDHWSDLYYKHTEEFDRKIDVLRTQDLEEIIAKKIVAKSLLKNRKTEIRDWENFKILTKRRHDAAVKIQTWWRGLMVRKQLGRFRRSAKKKIKKGKKGLKKGGKKKK